MNSDKARAKGLTYRPLAVTAAETLEWWQSEPAERRSSSMRAGITAEREAELLADWHARG